ncbi:MAG: MFS transporter [Chloroflexota bacterium]|nr:MFS transporter [Chloroflexota bacterium]
MSGVETAAARQPGVRGTALAAAGLILVLFLVSLDQTVVGTAMPRIIAELRGFERYAWVTTAYLLAETAVIPIVGKFGDLYGRKWITVAGVAVFLVGSALCGLATGMTWLIVARGIQGLGGGMLLATVFTLVADIFPDPAKRAKYQGVFFAVFALSSVIGPYLGGWITDNLNWRWVFYVNLPLGLLSLGVLPAVLPQSARRRGVRIDFLGAATITVAVVALLLALSWAGEGFAWTSGRVLAGLAVAAAGLAAFIPIELRAAEPVIPFALFRDRTLAAVSFVMFMVGIAMFGIILYTPLFVQGVLGRTATGSGAVLTPLVLTMTAMGIVGGQLIARTRRVKPFMLFGTVMMTLGVALLGTLGPGSGTRTVAAFLFVTGVGLGLLLPTTTLAVQTAAGQEQLGVATAATQFIRSVGATVGTAVIGTLVTGGYADELAAKTPPGVPPPVVAALQDPRILVSEEALRGFADAAAAFPGGQGAAQRLLEAARAALAGSIQDGFRFVLVAGTLAVVGALLAENLRLKEQPAVPPTGEAGAAEGSALTASVAGNPAEPAAVAEPAGTAGGRR